MTARTLFSYPRLRGIVLTWLVVAVLGLVAAWVYWPGIQGPELLDDRSSILVVEDLRDQQEKAMDFVFGNRSGLLGRPVSMSTFVLERVFLGDDLAISKRVNIVLHLLIGGLVIWLFALLFRFLAVPGSRGLAVLMGALWMLHPLLVSTVLYVVQRMAMLSTLFMLLATICYVYWRLALIRGERGLLPFILMPAFLVLGLLSKENAIVLVPILLLMEVLWFQSAGKDGETIHGLKRVSWGLIISGSAALLAVFLWRFESLTAQYYHRPFSMGERLLTQSRILWDYLGQWVWPDPARMGVYHDDVIISTGLADPRSTLLAVLAWLLALVVSGILLRWRVGRYLVFGLAWFLVGHAVESTVLPLELYFEHRNYFPAIGLLLSFGVLLGFIVKSLPETRLPLQAWVAILALVLAAMTSSQAQIWSSRPLLILTHLNGHPDSARANIDMAVQLARLGDIEGARNYSARAFELSAVERAGDREIRDLALSCIASAPVSREDVEKLGSVDPERPFSSVSTLLTLVRLIQDDACPVIDARLFADRLADIFLVEDFRGRASANMYSNLAVLENALQNWENAYAYSERFLALAPGNKRGLLMKLHFAAALGKVSEVEALIENLQAMDARGELTVGERQTLALYLEN